MSGTPRPPGSFATASVTCAAANALIEAPRGAAEAMGLEVAVAVTDVGGHFRAFERPDKTPFLASDLAINKAWTAASYGVATHTWNGYLADPQVAPLANVPRLTPVGGGIGVSGGTYQQDRDIAEAALQALGFEVDP